MAEEKIVIIKKLDEYVAAKEISAENGDSLGRIISLSPNRECSMTFKPDSLYVNGELLGKITEMKVE